MIFKLAAWCFAIGTGVFLYQDDYINSAILAGLTSGIILYDMFEEYKKETDKRFLVIINTLNVLTEEHDRRLELEKEDEEKKSELLEELRCVKKMLLAAQERDLY